MPVRVALDAVGGDHAPSVVVEGALRALREAPGRLQVQLFGPEALVRDALAAAGGTDHPDVTVVDAPDVVGMEESPAAALKTKPRSSISLGVAAVRDGAADAFASAGNTGACMAAGLFVLGRLPGVLRPALPGVLPSVNGSCLVVDVGANVDCRPEHLVQFAHMGAVYAEYAMGRTNPSIALLSVGEEETKGNEATKEAHERLRGAEGLNFVGNLEGRDILRHGADVFICDGFVGNIVLKLAESVASVLPQLIKQEIGRQGLSQEQAGTIAGVLRGTMAPFNPENVGGTPLLGVAGPLFIGHGDSSARAIEQMLYRAAEFVEGRLTERIQDALGGAQSEA